MSQILAISSQVACGHVGLSAIAPAIQALGHDIVALPTVLLSNHPGHAHVAGQRCDPRILEAMVDALNDNGWLVGIDTVLTGYLPTPEHVALACRTIDLVRANSPQATIICDPVIGDEAEGIYIDEAAALAIKGQLVPVADINLPNAFELSWICSAEINSEADAVAAARSLPCRSVLATSVPGVNADTITNLLITRDSVERCTAPKLVDVPKGTGDFLSGVFAADPDLARTNARVAALVEASIGLDHLAITTSLEKWRNAIPLTDGAS